MEKKKGLLSLSLALMIMFNVMMDVTISQGESAREAYSYLDNPSYEAYVRMFDATVLDHADMVFVGDSITARAKYEELFEGMVVANRGIPSDTSEGVYNRINQVIQLSPNIVFIMIGINDIGHEINPSEIAHNVEKSCIKIHEYLPETKIVIESVLPVTGSKLSKYHTTIEDINLLYSELNMKYDYISYFDLHSLFVEGGAQPLYFIRWRSFDRRWLYEIG